MKRLFGIVVAWVLVLAPVAASAEDFSKWAVLIVAGDNRAHSGAPSQVFDNARRDLADAFVKMGFRRDHMAQFSMNFDYNAHPTEAGGIARNFYELTHRVTGGCLIYFTSHGAPAGMVLGHNLLPPSQMKLLVDEGCPNRPAVIVMSSCYSGQFVEPLAATDHIVITASRADRTSFGCGELDHYTYFDDCFLRAIPRADDFATLGEQVQICVGVREQQAHASPPSQPQLSVGPNVAFTLRYK